MSLWTALIVSSQFKVLVCIAEHTTPVFQSHSEGAPDDNDFPRIILEQQLVFVISNPNLRVHYITFMGLQRRLKGDYTGTPHSKAVLGRKFCPVKLIGPEMAVFRELRG